MSTKSLSDFAYDVLKESEGEILFNELWTKVCEKGEFDEFFFKKKIASFYNALMLDSRFIALDGNRWDLRERQSMNGLRIDPDLWMPMMIMKITKMKNNIEEML